MSKYQEYILNYFNHKTTNAHTEGAYTKNEIN
ncbi:MAG: hypothetical protein H5U06_03945 [Candidatus Aminicenantes bacterium]|nr:hypothetical protein [Candidatus Aminicenantes bacterium]